MYQNTLYFEMSKLYRNSLKCIEEHEMKQNALECTRIQESYHECALYKNYQINPKLTKMYKKIHQNV